MAIGLSGRGGGFVAVDRDGAPIAGSWSDDRHRPQLARLIEWRKGGAHLSNYAAVLLAKYLWLRENQPSVADQSEHLLYAKDWLAYRMTGRAVTDPTSGPDADDFDRTAIESIGIEARLAPEVAPPWAVAGGLRADAAKHLGLKEGVPVAVGGHDGICANLGAGAGEPGAYAITLGTHAVVRAVLTESPPGAYRFYGMPPGRQIIGGNAVMAGRALDWFLDTWFEGAGEEARGDLFERMDGEASAVAPGAGGLRFLPFLRGQVAPLSRPGASAAFSGLRVGHGRAEMYRSVLEGGAFATRAIWDQVHEWCGEPTVVRFTGSGAISPVWRQIIVDCIGTACEMIDAASEARGAAIYAAVAIGEYKDVDEAASAMVRPTVRVEPTPEGVEAYADVYSDWSRVAEVMRELDDNGTKASGL